MLKLTLHLTLYVRFCNIDCCKVLARIFLVYQEGTAVKPLEGKEEAILKSKLLATKLKR
jgi:hypothetical protein